MHSFRIFVLLIDTPTDRRHAESNSVCRCYVHTSLFPLRLALLALRPSRWTSTSKALDTFDRPPPWVVFLRNCVFVQSQVCSTCLDCIFEPIAKVTYSAKQQSEVYTLGILNYKIHVINSRRLIPLVQRLSKTLSFTPFQQLTNKVLSDCTNYTVELHGDPDFMRELDKATRTALAPGTQLDSQNLKAADILVKSVDDLASDCSGSKPVRIQFWDWSTHVVTIASTNGVYGGSSNPFLKRELEETFWYIPLRTHFN